MTSGASAKSRTASYADFNNLRQQSNAIATLGAMAVNGHILDEVKHAT